MNNIRYSIPLHFVLVLTNWFPDNVIFLRIRGWLAHFFLKGSGQNLRLGRNVSFYNPASIFIGDNVYIAKGSWFSAGAKITINDEAVIGPYTVVASSNHTSLNGSFRYGKSKNKPIFIGRGVWIGAHSTVTAGVIMESGSCIAANSVVKGVTKSNSLYGGVPAKFIKTIDIQNEK